MIKKMNNLTKVKFLSYKNVKMHAFTDFFYFNSDKCMQSKTMTLLIYKTDNQHI